MSDNSSQPDDRTQYGGQAVVEGVMMRSPRYFAIACRLLSNNQIVVKREPVENALRKLSWLNQPLLRGTLALVDAMIMGIKALTYSANMQLSEETPLAKDETPAAEAVGLAMGEGALIPKSDAESRANMGSATINGIAIGATTVISLLMGFSLFWVIPGLAADHWVLPHFAHAVTTPQTTPNGITTGGRMAVNLAEGGIRLIIFFAYLTAISRMKHVQRVFEYHGAEHKAINTLEAGLPITLENARAADRIHPRCGTNFIFIVLITAILVFSVIPRHSIHEGIWLAVESHLLRLLLLPVVAGIAYEVLKLAGKYRHRRWARAMIAPGLWTQYLTTRVPSDDQIEVAIAALLSVWDKEHEPAGDKPGPLNEPAAAMA